jgi:pilus assembly protein CpaD
MSLNRIVCLALLCAGLAACASDPKNPAVTAKNPGELFPMKAEIKPDQLALALHADGLSPTQKQALIGLAARWREDGEDLIRVQAPHGGVDPRLAAHGQESAQAFLVSLGVPYASIQLTAYEVADSQAPLLVSFSRYEAKVTSCGTKWQALTDTEDNNVQSNFGCAISANMMAQIAHPADIAHPRAEDAPDAQRRETVIGKYAEGKDTATIVTGDKSAGVAQVAP